MVRFGVRRSSFGAKILAACAFVIPASALADPAQFLPLEPIIVSFGEPGVLEIDARGQNALLVPPAETPEFPDMETFVSFLETNFNALRIERDGAPVGFKLAARVRGAAVATDGDLFRPVSSPLAELIAGRDGIVRVNDYLACLRPECANPGRRSIFERDSDFPVPEPTWFIEGQLSLFYEEFGCGSPFGNCSVAAADSATIEHDGSFTPTELAWCITTAGLRYPCIKYNERNNELVVDLTVYTDYGPLGSWTHSYSLTEKNTERASLSVLLWDAHFEPPDVDVDGFHYGANFDHDKEMFRQTHLTVRP